MIKMSFEKIFKSDIINKKINNRYLQTYKERPHISKYRLETNENSNYININEKILINYSTKLSKTYIAAINIVNDLFVTLYSINSRNMFVFRLDLNNNNNNIKEFEQYLNKNKHNNLELRLFGFQNADINNNAFMVLNKLADIAIKYAIPISEIDLFGNEIRHIAIDLKIGSTFNILLENRLYRPGELISQPQNK